MVRRSLGLVCVVLLAGCSQSGDATNNATSAGDAYSSTTATDDVTLVSFQVPEMS